MTERLFAENYRAERIYIVAFAGMCPYLKDARSMERTICECARFSFPDRQTRRDILYGYCGHPSAWRACPFKLALDGYYERKYADTENACASFGADSSACRKRTVQKNV
jgi:hypothetical protein